jgi:hypothetical protein
MNGHGVPGEVGRELRSNPSRQEDAVKRFIARYADRVIGTLSGFDRLVFRGTLRRLSFVDGLMSLLWKRQVLLKDFGAYAEAVTERLKAASLEEARRAGRPEIYLGSSRTNKEEVALGVAARDGIQEGLIAVVSCVEPCQTFEVYRCRDSKRLELQPRVRKCLHLYHYFVDPVFGFMNARIQTWFPFKIQVCLNGREWLAREMDRAGMSYRRRDNCFIWLEDATTAQRLMDRQLKTDWPEALNRIARSLNPAHQELFRDFTAPYYWSAYQTEWASDVMFKDAAALAEIYPTLVMHGITTFGSADVMRFLGRRVRSDFPGEIVSDFKGRPEGVRIKHRLGSNSLKLYDKQGSILRPELTMNDPSDFKVFRAKEGDPNGPRSWRPLRRGVADLHRRATVSQAANERYLDALACVDTSTPIGKLTAKITRPVTWKGHRTRPLRPFSDADSLLLKAVSRGEFKINGLRNRDLKAILDPQIPGSPSERRRAANRVTRKLRLLQAHGILRRVKGTHRYIVTVAGQQIVAALIAAERASLEQLRRAVA